MRTDLSKQDSIQEMVDNCCLMMQAIIYESIIEEFGEARGVLVPDCIIQQLLPHRWLQYVKRN